MRDCPFCQEPLPPGVSDCPVCGAHFGVEATMSSAIDLDALASHVSAALARNQKIEAITIYREATGVGLKDAKDAIEAFAAGGRLALPGTHEIDDMLQLELLDLLQRGAPLAAVKLCMERTGAGLGAAKAAVDALAARHGLRSTSTGCGGVLAVLIVVAVIGAMVAAVVLLGLGSK